MGEGEELISQVLAIAAPFTRALAELAATPHVFVPAHHGETLPIAQ
jgi:hypothetical protein